MHRVAARAGARDNPSARAIFFFRCKIKKPNFVGSSQFVGSFYSACVAQLDRVPGYEPGGRRFESSRARHTNKKGSNLRLGPFLFAFDSEHLNLRRRFARRQNRSAASTFGKHRAGLVNPERRESGRASLKRWRVILPSAPC